MRFDPIYFISLCEKSGIAMNRKADLLCYSYENKQLEGEGFFIETMRQHKADILPLLAESREAIQLDLFSE